MVKIEEQFVYKLTDLQTSRILYKQTICTVNIYEVLVCGESSCVRIILSTSHSVCKSSNVRSFVVFFQQPTPMYESSCVRIILYTNFLLHLRYLPGKINKHMFQPHIMPGNLAHLFLSIMALMKGRCKTYYPTHYVRPPPPICFTKIDLT